MIAQMHIKSILIPKTQKNQWSLSGKKILFQTAP